MLVNVVLDVSGAPSITGEIQIHLYEILLIKEEGHHLYEITRAASVERLLNEVSCDDASSSDDVEEPIVDGSGPSSAIRAASSETVMSGIRRLRRFAGRYSYASMQDDGDGFEMKSSRGTATIDVRVDDAGSSVAEVQTQADGDDEIRSPTYGRRSRS